MWRTNLITVSICFLLGTTFTHWIADHNVLWRSPVTQNALLTSISYYSILSTAPHGLGWAYIAVGLVALLSTAGRVFKVMGTGKGEVVFDGGSTGKSHYLLSSKPDTTDGADLAVLLAALTYTQLSEVFPAILLFPTPLPAKLESSALFPILSGAARELASDNIKTAVMLTGVMLLQGGRYYSKRPSRVIEPISQPSTPPRSDDELLSAPKASHSPIAGRAATPFRELTEAEAMEVRSLEQPGQGLGGGTKTRKR